MYYRRVAKMTQLSIRTQSMRAMSTGSIFKQWKTPKVEVHGDYRDEEWLEETVGGPLYQHQKSLPRLPIPTIKDTLARFLPTALPLAKTKEEEQALKSAVEAFPSQAEVLQERLLQRQSEYSNSSWLQEWWNKLGYDDATPPTNYPSHFPHRYLQVRDPVVINVSYFFHFRDDHTASNQIERAAALLSATADFRKQICSGSIESERVGRKKTVLCSSAYKYLFHGTRIPQPNEDSYAVYDPAVNNHAIVACGGHFFAIDFCDASTGDAYSIDSLEKALMECQLIAAKSGPPAASLGWLTSQDRDVWARGRQAFLEASSHHAEALELLQSGAVLVCLDDQEPKDRAEFARQLLHAGSSAENGANRWFDKSIQLIVTPSGQAGLLGEHAMMDGMPVVRYADHLTGTTHRGASQHAATTSNSCNVREIFNNLSVNESLTELVSTGRHETATQSFRGYGGDFIKQAGFSPDAFVQMAMQLATFRLWEEQAGTYEATQVRPFLHGRTETTRTVSTQSSAFVRAMGLKPKRDEHEKDVCEEKILLLRAAVDAHTMYIGSASKAQGVDRHFFGLSMVVENNEVAPSLFSDPVFARSKRWRVSTSNLTHPAFENWGYGEVFPDGVGLSYSVHKTHCLFNIVALKENGWVARLSDLLEESLVEMQSLILADKANVPQSKL